MDGSLADDVFDLLEGTLDELMRTRAWVRERIDVLIVGSRMREVRCAVAALAALMRGGHDWRPAEDGHEATTWRETILAALADPPADDAYVALVRRELDELVALAARATGPRRPLPEGSFERLARRAGVRRAECITLARVAEDDHVAGWNEMSSSRALVRIPLALGISGDDLARELCAALLAFAGPGETRDLLAIGAVDPQQLAARSIAIPPHEYKPERLDNAASTVLDMIARRGIDAMRLEWAMQSTLGVIEPDAVREYLTTSDLRTRLAKAEPS